MVTFWSPQEQIGSCGHTENDSLKRGPRDSPQLSPLTHRAPASSPPDTSTWFASLSHVSCGQMFLRLLSSVSVPTPYSCSPSLSQMPVISFYQFHVFSVWTFWPLYQIITYVFIDLHKAFLSWPWHWPFVSHQEIQDLHFFWGLVGSGVF